MGLFYLSSILGFEIATKKYEAHCEKLRMYVNIIIFSFSKLDETVRQRKYARRQKKVNPPTKQRSK